MVKGSKVTTMKRTRELKEIIVSTKMPTSILLLIDSEAQHEGTSRSHIIRRRLLDSYRKQVVKVGA